VYEQQISLHHLRTRAICFPVTGCPVAMRSRRDARLSCPTPRRVVACWVRCTGGERLYGGERVP